MQKKAIQERGGAAFSGRPGGMRGPAGEDLGGGKDRSQRQDRDRRTETGEQRQRKKN